MRELWVLAGRRVVARQSPWAPWPLYLAVCIDYSGVFTHGERGTCAIMASTTTQAHSLMNIVKGVFEDNPRFSALVDAITSDTIVLRNRIDIVIRPASYRSIRGITGICAIAEEISAWQSDELGSRNPDKQILAAVRPALATTGGPLISIGSPYGKSGEPWKVFKKHFGQQGIVD